MQQSQSKPIFAVVYYCGHGVSSNLTNATYLIPGQYCDCAFTKDITFEYNYKQLMQGQPLSKKIDSLQYIQMVRTITDLKHYDNFCIYLGDIYDTLKSLDISFMIFADCCLDADSFTKPPKHNQFWEDSVKTKFQALRDINRYREKNPVLFSTKFGETANTVLTTIEGQSFSAGPVCRRIYSTSKFLRRRKKLTLSEFITLLTNSKINNSGSKCFTYYRPDKNTGSKTLLLW